MPRVRLPNSWEPRPYQLPLWRYLEAGGRHAVGIWHRRAGKDDVALHWAAVSAVQRTGTYWHMLPEAAQARKAIWEAVNPHSGLRRIDEAFPPPLRETIRENEMFLRLKNGSTWQVLGSDNFNSLVGSPPIGIVYSEWALANPAAWAYMRPILAENGGWALKITTPRGRNHAHTDYEAAREDAAAFAQVLPATDTDVFSAETLEAERAAYIREWGEGAGQNLFDQEYLCSFDAAIIGAYWGKELREAERQERIGHFPADPAMPVHTVWDLGIGDSMAIWLWQVVGRDIRIVDYIEGHGEGFEHYCQRLDALGHRYGDDWVPHDAQARELGTGRTRMETLWALKRKPRLVVDHRVDDRINAVRLTLPRVHFNVTPGVKQGLEALRQYREGYDDKARVFTGKPKHDWASHAADAFGYLAMAWRELAPAPPPPKPRDRYARRRTMRPSGWAA